MIKDLGEFKNHSDNVHRCSRCHLGCDNRIVGIGNARAHILIVMDSPRKEEIEHKRALCYESGLYLQRCLLSAGFEPGYCFITYCVNCVLPEIRLPLPSEYGPCFTNLWKTIELFDPKLILSVGLLPTQVLCKPKKSVSALQGEILKINKYKVMPVSHPSYIMKKGTKIQIKNYLQVLKKARDMVYE